MSARGGVCSWGEGVYLLRGVVSALGGCLVPGEPVGGVGLLGGSGPGGSVCWGGVSAPRGVSQHALRQTPPVKRMTNRCKNITLATTSLRPVTTRWSKTAGLAITKLGPR